MVSSFITFASSFLRSFDFRFDSSTERLTEALDILSLEDGELGTTLLFREKCGKAGSFKLGPCDFFLGLAELVIE